MARAKKRGGRLKARKHVSTAATPWGGDHGTGTQAANQGTVMEAITDEKGSNPNHMGRRRRVDVVSTLSLTMRQEQAAKAIRDAYSRVEMLSSGGELKEWVQSSPKPDAAIARQVDANSQWVHVTTAIKPVDRAIVDHVCCLNLPLVELRGYRQASQRLKQSLDRVADHMRY